MKIQTKSIQTNAGTQVRAGLDEDRIECYAAAMHRGEQLPPLHVFQQEGEPFYILSDGFHRLAAARKLGKTDVEVEVHIGDRRDAVLFGIEANSKHGMPLDKRRAITVLLQDPVWSQWNNSEIARVCGASDVYVGRVRKELSSNQFDDGSRLVKRGGKTYRQKRMRKAAGPQPDAGHQTLLPTDLRKAYKVIVASPPWGKMNAEDICRLPVGDLAGPDCALWLWTNSAHLADAVAALNAWGFNYQEQVTLVKVPCAENTLTCHTEQWLVGIRGAAEVDMTDTDGEFLAENPVETICALAERSAPIRTRNLMLFTDMNREDWDSFGDSVTEQLSEKVGQIAA